MDVNFQYIWCKHGPILLIGSTYVNLISGGWSRLQHLRGVYATACRASYTYGKVTFCWETFDYT